MEHWAELVAAIAGAIVGWFTKYFASR